MIGRAIAHYQILEKLGEGGMGVVYKARDTQLDRLVAIKVLQADKVANPDRKLRFVQEAKAASALNHPNIVTIHDIGTEDGADYIVMEYVGGLTLDRLMPRGGLKLAELLKYAIPIADGVARAHAAGIVHRDHKPGNIIIADDGQVKLLDFGLAKLSDLHDASDSDLTRPKLAKHALPCRCVLAAKRSLRANDADLKTQVPRGWAPDRRDTPDRRAARSPGCR